MSVTTISLRGASVGYRAFFTMFIHRVEHSIVKQSQIEVPHHAWRKVCGVSACLPVGIRIGDGDRRCSATLRGNKILQRTCREIV
ncbi:hypothetical protein [Enhydrobacter aerosaccus]|uniref:hypothetical protein n=1 Tax=Enhydrobacter aerosaccus TaxID=225324 RepID=UPI0011163F56|nr:hypothetical protein [Enhydrobacter aerosaccus]